MSKDIRVRYAPSPTGLLHIGNAHDSIVQLPLCTSSRWNFLLSVSKILTVKRHVEDGERSQLENLRWLGMDWDESPETHEKLPPV